MFDLRAEEARLLLDIAMMAIGGNRYSTAARLLAVLEQFRPDHPSLIAAKALALINAQQLEAALSYLDGTALVKCPDSAMLKAFKGMVLLRLSREGEAQRPLREAAEQTEDQAAANLAKGLLNE